MQVRRLFALAIVAIMATISVLFAAPASAASSGEFVSAINGLRASKGLGALNVDSRLSSVAQDWANQMAAAGKISHRPNLSGSVSGWSKLGENVGVGGSVDSIFGALVNSSGHYRNMVDSSFTSVGVGVAVGADGRIYTAHDFATFSGAPAAKAPAAAKAAAPAKPAVTTAAPRRTSAPVPAPTAPVTTAPVVAPAPAPVAEPVVAPAPAPAPKPVAAQQIMRGFVEVSNIATQG